MSGGTFTLRYTLRSFAGSLTVMTLLLGCFFELDELVPLPIGLGGSGNGGIGGLGGGGGFTQGGGANGGSGGRDDPCPLGQKRCGGSGPCVAMTPENGCGDVACVPCGRPAQASVSCNMDTGSCRVDQCEAGYADCNGDVINTTGSIPGDGCEHSFGTIAPFADPLDAPKSVNIQIDDDRDDWNGVPAQTFTELCADCTDDLLPLITEDARIPERNDLDAYFRVAWDGNFFYLLGEVFDDHRFNGGATVGGQCTQQGHAACDDGFQVFFDGKNNRQPGSENGYDNDDHRVFLGLSGGFATPGQGPAQNIDVTLQTKELGAFCYRIEARFDWQYIVGTRGGAPAEGQLPPAPGLQYGFDIGVNDWDPSISDANVIERQSLVFWINPGDRYRNQLNGIGSMVLSDRSGAAGPP